MTLFKRIIFGTVSLTILIIAFNLIHNNFINNNYSDLSKEDQQILVEYNQYYNAATEKDVWQNFNLQKQTILAINNKVFGSSYLINPKTDIHNPFAKEIKLPDAFHIKVYRIPYLSLERAKFIFAGNFNGKNEKYNVHNNNVFFTKYSAEESVNKKWSSSHYITFLTHEAFHYYAQEKWKDAFFHGENMSDKELDLLDTQYQVLTDIQMELLKPNTDKNVLNQFAKRYVEAMKNRIQGTNKNIIKHELEAETMEGTAEYIGIKASQIVGYDYGVMYFDNQKNVPFSTVVPLIKEGKVDQSRLRQIVYSSGALLSQLLEKLEVNGWQEKLNRQNEKNPITLYSVVEDYVNNLNKEDH